MTPSIFMDGKRLAGTGWILPEDWEASDIELGLLPAMKGASPSELPEIGPPTDDTPHTSGSFEPRPAFGGCRITRATR